jgi:hypothetical protein
MGSDTLTAGSNSTITAGNGSDTLVLGTGDTVSVGNGSDVFEFQNAGPPSLTVPSTLMVNEHGSIAFPISIIPASLGVGHETISGFSAAANDVLEFSTSQFASFAAVMADAKQVGQNVVITIDASDSITLNKVQLSSLQAKDFAFVSGAGGGNISVTISGIPAGVTLSDSAGGLTVMGGSITLTSAQLAGLTLQAGSVTTTTLSVTATIRRRAVPSRKRPR